MTPRRFLNFFRSPTGALALFLIGLVIVLLLVNSRRPSQNRISLIPQKSSAKAGPITPQLPETVRRNMVPFDPSNAEQKVEPTPPPAPKPEGTPQLPVLSLIAETPALAGKEGKKFSPDFAPFGRLIPCELIITVDSSSIQTPIIGLVTEDIFHHGQLIIPAGPKCTGRRKSTGRGNASRATDAGRSSGRMARN